MEIRQIWQGGQSSAHRRYEKRRARLVSLKSDEGGSDTPYQAAKISALIGERNSLHYRAVARLRGSAVARFRGSALNKRHQMFQVVSSAALLI